MLYPSAKGCFVEAKALVERLSNAWTRYSNPAQPLAHSFPSQIVKTPHFRHQNAATIVITNIIGVLCKFNTQGCVHGRAPLSHLISTAIKLKLTIGSFFVFLPNLALSFDMTHSSSVLNAATGLRTNTPSKLQTQNTVKWWKFFLLTRYKKAWGELSFLFSLYFSLCVSWITKGKQRNEFVLYLAVVCIWWIAAGTSPIKTWWKA